MKTILLIIIIPFICFSSEFFLSSNISYENNDQYAQLGAGVGILGVAARNNYSFKISGNFKTDKGPFFIEPVIGLDFSYYYRLLSLTASTDLINAFKKVTVVPYIGIGFILGNHFLYRPEILVSSKKDLRIQLSVFYVGD